MTPDFFNWAHCGDIITHYNLIKARSRHSCRATVTRLLQYSSWPCMLKSAMLTGPITLALGWI